MVLGYKLLNSTFVEVLNLNVIYARSSRLSLTHIPENLRFPDLEIPRYVSHKYKNFAILGLPYWVYQLTKLEELILRVCELLIELPHEVGTLGNLKVLDLEGTYLVYLPEELKELIALTEKAKTVAIIPSKTLSKLAQLEELSINVDPQDVWCGPAMEAVMEDLPSLRKLKILKLYLPDIKLLQDLQELKGKNDLLICQNLSDFKLIIGPHDQHFISHLPCDLEEEFLKLKKCLKYINGEDSTPRLAEALRHTSALYLDRHWTLHKLSIFKFEDLTKLKFCLLMDCNEMQTLFDGSDFNFGIVNNEEKFLAMQYLAIHYLRKLEVIWKGPEILPRLRKLSLLYLPELVSMFDDFSIGPELEYVVIYDCPKLERLPSMGVCNKEVIEVKGESEWWNALEWNESSWSGGRPYCLRPFSESDTDEDLQDELAPRYGNTLRLLLEDCNSS
ncbi:hypothetical protein AgCh_022736 [Apium graveolens]